MATTIGINAQNVGIGVPAPTEKLDVLGTARLRNLSSADFQVVYADPNGVLTINPPADRRAWMVYGNAGLTTGVHFLGTTDAVALDFRTNNLIRFRIPNNAARLLAFQDGTATAPTYSWNADPDIGMYRIGVDILGFSTTGAERMRIDNIGRVTIGANNPVRNLPGFGTVDGRLVVVDNSNTTGSEAVVIISTTGDYPNGLIISHEDPNNGWPAIEADQPNDPPLFTRYIAISGIGSFTSTSNFDVNTGINGHSNTYGGYGGFFSFYGGTNLAAAGWAVYADGWAGGTTAWQNVSDARIKNIIRKFDNALDIIEKINVYEFKYNTTQYNLNLDTTAVHIGFIAQEVEQVLPNIVREANIVASAPIQHIRMAPEERSKIYTLKTMGYSELVPILLEAIKEQQQQIEELKKELSELKKHIK